MSNLIVKDLHKNFGKKQVVRGVDFSMTTGEVLGLLGPNGAGKTTTFYMVVGLVRANKGQVLIEEE
ncbi:MAG: ATP-binding cassette domain-containing protein, partial [Treponemataceae bacterium]|nr:ATP-binding cassette domain-containing protein [Treponemataceae bacterium]